MRSGGNDGVETKELRDLMELTRFHDLEELTLFASAGGGMMLELSCSI